MASYTIVRLMQHPRLNRKGLELGEGTCRKLRGRGVVMVPIIIMKMVRKSSWVTSEQPHLVGSLGLGGEKRHRYPKRLKGDRN